MIEKWNGKRVTVMGLGRFGGGTGVTRWLARQGARVTVTDLAPAEKMQPSLQEIAGLDVTLRLGGHDEGDFTETDLVVVSPAVPDRSTFLQAAAAAGVAITTEINLFVERCAAELIGVTGSVGKSTTTAMIGHVLERTLQGRRVWVGGNIGRSLLDALPQFSASDVVVLELSSFQLHRTPLVRWSPRTAVITNITPNHLDWHESFAGYVADKLNILRFQEVGRDRIVVGAQPGLLRAIDQAFGDLAGVWRVGLDGEVPTARMQSTSAEEFDDQRLRWADLKLVAPGRHNRENAGAALTVAHAFGVSDAAAAAALASFEGLDHRLQRVTVRNGVTYYNDSKSSTPEATITALNAIETPVLVILGGYDKGIDLSPAAVHAARRAKFSACIGQTGTTLLEKVRGEGGEAELFADLPTAVAACRARAEEGDSILLSPACASWDMFEDYRARGALFAKLAREA